MITFFVEKSNIFVKNIETFVFAQKGLLQNGGLCIETTSPSAALTLPLTQGRPKNEKVPHVGVSYQSR